MTNANKPAGPSSVAPLRDSEWAHGYKMGRQDAEQGMHALTTQLRELQKRVEQMLHPAPSAPTPPFASKPDPYADEFGEEDAPMTRQDELDLEDMDAELKGDFDALATASFNTTMTSFMEEARKRFQHRAELIGAITVYVMAIPSRSSPGQSEAHLAINTSMEGYVTAELLASATAFVETELGIDPDAAKN